jgi:hypothetical protein
VNATIAIAGSIAYYGTLAGAAVLLLTPAVTQEHRSTSALSILKLRIVTTV